MVFTKLSTQEKDAFFGLLDEYFQSRPELFGQNAGGQGVGLAGTGISTAAAASVVQRALAANAPGSSGSASGVPGKSNNPYAVTMTPNLNNVDVARAMTAGRVAAASLAFSGAGGPASSQSSSPSPLSLPQIHLRPAAATAVDGPPSLPRRTASNVPASLVSAEVGLPGSEVDKLVTRKTGLFSTSKKTPTGSVSIPSAFVAPRNTFGPPPVRRAASDTSTDTSSTTLKPGGNGSLRGAGVGTRAMSAPAPEEVAEGEWAEVLYDYSSEDPGDLAIEAGTRVFVTTKSSEDWWTGQVEGQGREGLFPASYVKLL